MSIGNRKNMVKSNTDGASSGSMIDTFVANVESYQAIARREQRNLDQLDKVEKVDKALKKVKEMQCNLKNDKRNLKNTGRNNNEEAMHLNESIVKLEGKSNELRTQLDSKLVQLLEENFQEWKGPFVHFVRNHKIQLRTQFQKTDTARSGSVTIDEFCTIIMDVIRISSGHFTIDSLRYFS